MMVIVEQMMRSWDNDVSVEKVVDRVVDIEGQFDGTNITRFDVSKARQISSFKRVVTNNIQRTVIELQEGRTMSNTNV